MEWYFAADLQPAWLLYLIVPIKSKSRIAAVKVICSRKVASTNYIKQMRDFFGVRAFLCFRATASIPNSNCHFKINTAVILAKQVAWLFRGFLSFVKTLQAQQD